MRAKRDKAFPLMDASSAVYPTVRELGTTLYLAYYLPGGEASALVSFSEVTDWSYGYPNDEGLQEHRFYGKGLRHYEFHRVVHPGPNAEPVRPYHWIATFHDGTFEIEAESWRTEASEIAESAPWKALDSLLAAGENKVLDELA
ncbi:hypothetical protein LCGC14_2804930 [marine sediment metagenome]|uniref:Uncharacterized protein n=1 Tax=marine sediment metagenome TaxID=412755 RepID=A0A0F8YLM2_9ZZZZ